jgi:superkiller protein 3
MIYMDKGMMAEAEEQFAMAINLEPEDAFALSNMGKLLVMQGRHDEGIASLKKAIEVQPDYAFAYYNLGKAYQDLHDFPNAIYNLMFALNYEPEDVYAFNVLGRMFLEVGLNDRALRIFDQVLVEIKSDDYYSMLGKAEALEAMQRKNDALMVLGNLKVMVKDDKALLEKVTARINRLK